MTSSAAADLPGDASQPSFPQRFLPIVSAGADDNLLVSGLSNDDEQRGEPFRTT